MIIVKGFIGNKSKMQSNGYNYYLDLFNQIDASTIVIVSNSTLRYYLLNRYLEYSSVKKVHVLLYDAFISIDNFFDRLYKHAQMFNTSLPNIISDNEARFLFAYYINSEKEIFNSGYNHSKNVLSTWKILHDWNLEIKEIEEGSRNKNTYLFIKWVKQFQKQLKSNNWIDRISVASLLLKEHKTLNLVQKKLGYKKIILIGFDVLTPRIKLFLKYYKNTFNILVKTWKLSPIKSNLKVVEYMNDEIEIKRVATIISHLKRKNPNATFGVISPKIKENFYYLINTFDKFFTVGMHIHNPILDNSMRSYIIKSKESLLDQSIVYQVFLWLRFGNIDKFDDIQSMLGSYYIKGQETYKTQRYYNIIKLKTQVPSSIDLNDLVKTKNFMESCDSILLKIIKEMTKFTEDLKKEKKLLKASEFLEAVKKIFKIIGYLDGCKLTNLEQQSLDQFYRALDKFIILGRLDIKLYFDRWLIELVSLIKNTIFQPKIAHNRPNIFILEASDAKEIYFDYLFVINMTSDNWPNFNYLNPYLPISLQKSKLMPNSDVNHEINCIKNATNDFIYQTKHIQFSYARFSKGEVKKRSPLLAPFTSNFSSDFTEYDSEEVKKKPIYFKEFKDKTLNKLQTNSLKLGSQFFKNFMECPYRTALLYRLNLSPNKHKTPLSRLDRGIIIHHILEKIWSQLKSSQTLINMSESILTEFVRRHIRDVIIIHTYSFDIIPKLLKSVEIVLLEKLILKWLNYEKSQRKEFKILALERDIIYKNLGVVIKLRLDRIDKLIDNKMIVIDYKTCKSYLTVDLLKKSVTDPQLILYAICVDSDDVGVAIVNGTKVDLKFISRSLINCRDKINRYREANLNEKKARDDYAILKRYWRLKFYKQILYFVSGELAVTPSVHNCQYCEFSYVCRMSYSG